LGPEQASTIQKFVAYRTAMLAAISHDLRTPLTRIRLRGELIEDEVQQARLFLDVNELQTMVDGALAFFRGDADEEAVTSLDLPRLLQTIANDYADQDIEIAYEGPSHALYRGRPIALKLAFTNLIENAVKYGTPPQRSNLSVRKRTSRSWSEIRGREFRPRLWSASSPLSTGSKARAIGRRVGLASG